MGEGQDRVMARGMRSVRGWGGLDLEDPYVAAAKEMCEATWTVAGLGLGSRPS